MKGKILTKDTASTWGCITLTLFELGDTVFEIHDVLIRWLGDAKIQVINIYGIGLGWGYWANFIPSIIFPTF